MFFFKKTIINVVVMVFVLMFTQCGAIQDAIDSLANFDSCDDFDSLSTTLNEACRDLEGLLPEASDSLNNLAKVITVRESGDHIEAVLMITGAQGSVIDNLEAIHIDAEKSSNGTDFADVTPSHFDRFETLATDEAGQIQMSLASIIDYSGSILDADLDDVNTALGVLYNNLPSYYKSEVLKFSDTVAVYPTGGFTSVKQELLNAIADQSLERNMTALYDGIYDGVEDLLAETSTLRVAILFTDGQDNSSTKTYDQVKVLFQQHKIPVCVIGVGFASVDTLNQIAEDSGCFYIYKPSFGDLSDAYTSVVDQLNNLYRVRFNASDLNSGDTVRLSVSVPGEESARQNITFTIP